jgi:hypothetical protein
MINAKDGVDVFREYVVILDAKSVMEGLGMRFSEILNRLTGISCPVFGVSWIPAETERDIARKLIIYLEPRRVLYSEYEYETIYPCVASVTEIKNYLTLVLQALNENSKLNPYIRSMRNACNKFLNKCPDRDDFRRYAGIEGNISNWIFTSAIGELRCNFGIMIGQISKVYGLDVKDDLAQIIPE